mmetsp:Transcript_2396/g.3984  ORF Transcript_2396/g.3984 Transcript_2396/m.3984 type:complete len:324 (+) Transcript_2396:927-1898(+)
MGGAAGLVVGAGHVEGHAVVEDDPVAVGRAQRGHRALVDGLEFLARLHAGLHGGEQFADKGPCAVQAGSHLRRALERRAAAGHEGLGLQRGDGIQRGRPVRKVGIAAVGRGIELDEVAAEQHALLGQPGHRVARGVTAAGREHLDLDAAEVQREAAAEGERGPGEAGRHRLDIAEQPREAADLAGLVLLAALPDQGQRRITRDDLLQALGLEGAGAQHPHRVVVAQQHVFDRHGRHLADAADHIGRHHRRGLGVDHHRGVAADDDAGVGVALGGVGPAVFGQALEGDALFVQVGLRGKGFGGHWRSPSAAGLKFNLFQINSAI